MSFVGKLIIFLGLVLIYTFEMDAAKPTKKAKMGFSIVHSQKVAATTPKSNVGKAGWITMSPCSSENAKLKQCTEKQRSTDSDLSECRTNFNAKNSSETQCKKDIQSRNDEVGKCNQNLQSAISQVNGCKDDLESKKSAVDSCERNLVNSERALHSEPTKFAVYDCKKELGSVIDAKIKAEKKLNQTLAECRKELQSVRANKTQLENNLRELERKLARGGGSRTTFGVPMWTTVMVAVGLHLVLLRAQLAIYKPGGFGKKMEQDQKVSEEEGDDGKAAEE